MDVHPVLRAGSASSLRKSPEEEFDKREHLPPTEDKTDGEM